jgi:sugar fermentation stimulation protein A
LETIISSSEENRISPIKTFFTPNVMKPPGVLLTPIRPLMPPGLASKRDKSYSYRAMQHTDSRSAVQLFSDPEEALFVTRPNRFIMMVRDRKGKLLKAHCPNPGKLTEFLVPGQVLLIERHRSPERRTDCTAVAVQYKGKIIPLYASKANEVVKHLILPELHPGSFIVPEFRIGRSRFDFLARKEAAETSDTIVEVKSCSLCEHGLAMFPDAATVRGSRHVEELLALSDQGYKGEVIFVVSHEDASLFMPNPHTDPLFCRTLHRARKKLNIRVVSAATDKHGFMRIIDRNIPVDTDTPELLAEQNRGVYLLLAELKKPLGIPVPGIGNPVLDPGWYIYAGSAKTNLRQRVARHLRKKKKTHWHIDHLTRKCAGLTAFPVLTHKDLECPLAGDISQTADTAIEGFGCSDCSCSSHLFYFQENPLHKRQFLETLFLYRHQRFL